MLVALRVVENRHGGAFEGGRFVQVEFATQDQPEQSLDQNGKVAAIDPRFQDCAGKGKDPANRFGHRVLAVEQQLQVPRNHWEHTLHQLDEHFARYHLPSVRGQHGFRRLPDRLEKHI